MAIPGLKLGAKPPTDEEYVESVREWIGHPKKAGLSIACSAVLLFAAAFSWMWLGFDFVSRIAAKDLYSGMLAIGMMFGMKEGLALVLGVGVLWAVRKRSSAAWRTEWLTLRFYDELGETSGNHAAKVMESAQAPNRKPRALGLRLRRKTDDQYVDSIRRRMKRSQWSVVFAIALLVLLAAEPVTEFLLWKSVDLWMPMDGSWRGFALGVPWGMITGSFLCFFFESMGRLGRIVCGCRTECLMLRYYDELNHGKSEGGAMAWQTSP